MKGFTHSDRFKSALTSTLIAMIVYPAIKSALSAAGGESAMSIDSILANIWPGALVFGVFYGLLAVGYAAFLYKNESKGDGQ